MNVLSPNLCLVFVRNDAPDERRFVGWDNIATRPCTRRCENRGCLPWLLCRWGPGHPRFLRLCEALLQSKWDVTVSLLRVLLSDAMHTLGRGSSVVRFVWDCVFLSSEAKGSPTREVRVTFFVPRATSPCPLVGIGEPASMPMRGPLE